MNKPYLAVDSQGSIFTTDPEKHRILQFNRDGGFTGAMGQYGLDNNSLNLPVGIAIDALGRVYVTDSGNNRVMRFKPAR
ncbi:MAG: hypothetical protein HYX88_00020 [Chloroflexi bacterium]|nr:hypothetical protein [Chloroflexota bacterium]